MIDEITEFILKYGKFAEEERTKFVISKHLEYGTYVLLRDKENKLIAFAGFDINNKIAKVLRTVVRPDFRNKRILKLLVYMSKLKFPFLEFLFFERDKYNGREAIHSLNSFLRR